MLRLFALALLAVAAARATVVSINELICDTNITMQETNVEDSDPTINPSWQISATTIPVQFSISDSTLDSLFYLVMDTTTVSVEAFFKDGSTQVGSTQTWSDLLLGQAIAVLPTAYTGCSVIGCDGFKLDAVNFLQLFPKNATYFTFSAVLKYYGNTTVPSSSAAVGWVTQALSLGGAGQFKGMSAPPASAPFIGSTVAVVNLTATASVVNQAFPSASSSSALSTGAIAGIVVASVVFLLIVYGLWVWVRSDHVPLKGDGTEAGRPRNVEMTLQPATTGGRYGAPRSRVTGQFTRVE